MRRYLCAVAALAVVAQGCTSPRRDIEKVLVPGCAAGFNVVLITLDTTRADRLGSYGYEKAATPVLDRLAQEGIRFADAVSPAPLTLTAHASILTGLDPQHHGVRHNGQYRLDTSRMTLAEVLREHGYETAAFISAFVLDGRYGLNQGFDLYDDRVEPTTGPFFAGLESERSAEKVTNTALQWVHNRNNPQKPFFLWVHYYDPHTDYKPPGDYARRFQASLYDGEIAYMDSEIGRLLGSFNEKTLIVLVGDHGESLGEHAEPAHSRFIYESTQKVPFIIWSPPLIRGPFVVDDVAVGIVDVFPTVLDLLGITYDGPRDGVGVLRAREQRDRIIYMETMATYLDNGWAPLHGLRRHKDKYIFAPRPEYYDLGSDPKELDNLHRKAEAAEAVRRLTAELGARIKDSPSAEAIAAAATKPDPESLRRLQALGYLSGPGPTRASKGDRSLPDPKDMMPVQKLVMEARGLRTAHRLDEALARVRRALGMAPKDLEALQEAGLIYVEMDRLEEAEKFFRTYIHLKPNPNVNILLAQILAETGRAQEGEALLKQALSLEPDHGGVMITYGDLLAKRGQYSQALEWYEKAKRVDPYRATAPADKRIVELRRRASGS